MSASDLDKGARWSSDLATQLEETSFGIICLTSENLEAPWIIFEAGALSKTLDKTFVCPYLLDVEPTDLKGPLVQFQATKAQREDTKKLIITLNHALGSSQLPQDKLEKAFDVWWPELEQKLKNIPSEKGESRPGRPDREMLEEILELVRAEGRDSRSFAQVRDNFMSLWSKLLESSLQADPNLNPEVTRALIDLNRNVLKGAKTRSDDYPHYLRDYLRNAINDGEVAIDEGTMTARILIDALGSDTDIDTDKMAERMLARSNRIRGLKMRLESLGYTVVP